MPPILKPDPSIGINQCAKLKEIRESRDEKLASEKLNKVKTACSNGNNLFPLVLDALRANCTLGEIIGVMKDVFGTWMAPSGF